MAQIDSLEIQITADSQKAVSSLKNLSQSLQNISSALAQVNTTGFGALTSGIDGIATAMNNYAHSGVKTADFTRIATQLNRLSNVNTAGLLQLASSVNSLTGITTNLASLGSANAYVGDFARALGRLGSANIERAITSIPRLGIAMRDLLTTLSQSPQVSRNVTTLTRALADLTGNLGNVRTVSTGASRGLNLFTNSAQKTTSASKGLASAIGKVYATYWLLFRAFSVFGKAIKYASSLTEIQNVVEQTFGQSTEKINEFSRAAKDSLGMSELTYKEIASRFQAMGSAMDVGNAGLKRTNEYLEKVTNGYNDASSKASGMSITLTKLAGDMASFYDKDQSEVAKDLEAIYTGMTRPLRKYGLDLTQATLQEYANKRGIDAKVSSMTQAEKTMLRYQYVLENTTSAQGDFLRTADTWANQVKIMKQNFISLGTTIGQVFINAFKPWIRTLNSVLVAVNNFAIKVANALGNIFGWVYEGNDVGLLSEIEDESGGLADNLGQADKNAKKLKNTIMGYDELNVMQEPKDKDGSGSGVDDALGGGLSVKDKTTNPWRKAYESDINDLFGLGRKIADTLQKMMEGINWDSIYEKARNFGKGLAEFLNGLFKPEMFYQLGRTIAGCINTALNFLESFADEFKFDQLGVAIGEAINGFFEEFKFKLAARTLNKFVQGIFETIKSAIKTVKWGEVWNGIKDFISEIDDSTVLLIVGAWLTPKVLALFKSEVMRLITSAFGGSLVNMAGGLLLTIEVALVVKNLISDVDDYKEAMGTDSFWDALLNGDKEKKKEYAENKKYNPYRDLDKEQKTKIKDSTNLLDAKSYARLYAPQKEDFDSLYDYQKAYEEFSQVYEKKFGTSWFANLSRSIGELQASQVSLNDILNNSGNDYFEKYVAGAKDSSDAIIVLKDDTQNFSDTTKETTTAFDEWVSGIGKSLETNKNSVGEWFNESVKPWFSSEKWSSLWDSIKGVFNTKWGEIESWWKSTGLYKWYNENVKPWFTKEKWETEWNNIVNAFKTKWGEIESWWKTSGLYKWFNENVKPWFTKEKWETEWNNVKNAFETKWNEIVEWWKTSAIYKWYEEHVKPWFDKENWSFSGIKDGLEQAFNGAIDGVKAIFNKFIEWINSKLTISWDAQTIMGKKIIDAGSITLGKLPTFATGGFPEDGLFMANHNELVGEFSNGKTAVANNQQITEGIKQAVVEGMMNVVMATSGNNNQDRGDINLYLDGRVIAQTTYNNLKTMSRQGVIPRFV